eukprot:g10900.t1
MEEDIIVVMVSRVYCLQWILKQSYPHFSFFLLRCSIPLSKSHLKTFSYWIDQSWKFDRMPRGKPVVCVETGQEYVNTSAAAQAMGLFGNQNIWKSIVYGWKAGGYHWQYVEEFDHSWNRTR